MSMAISSAFFMMVVVPPAIALTELNDSELGIVSGQALFVADSIVGSGLGAGYNYTRVGLDVALGLNANINKLQLGCGGYNQSIVSGCDIDLDYVSLMGRSGNTAGAVGSDFVLTRPYIEIATKGSGSTKEVVGIKIGAQSADGFFGIGRRYAINEVNLENGGTCTTGAPLNCHSGINRISGYLNAEFSGQIPVAITPLGTQTACFGRTTINASCPMTNAPVYAATSGTRLNNLVRPGIPLTLSAGFLSAIGISQAYATIDENLRFVHGFALANTSDFFLSFQRERLYYPTYDKTGYSAAAANAGWWMNVPDVKVMDVQGATVSLGLFAALRALASPGPVVSNSELNQVPPSNCYGSSKFC